MLKRGAGKLDVTSESTDISDNDGGNKKQRHALAQRFFVEKQKYLFQELQTTTHYPSENPNPTKLQILAHAITSYKALEDLLKAKDAEIEALRPHAVASALAAPAIKSLADTVELSPGPIEGVLGMETGIDWDALCGAMTPVGLALLTTPTQVAPDAAPDALAMLPRM